MLAQPRPSASFLLQQDGGHEEGSTARGGTAVGDVIPGLGSLLSAPSHGGDNGFGSSSNRTSALSSLAPSPSASPGIRVPGVHQQQQRGSGSSGGGGGGVGGVSGYSGALPGSRSLLLHSNNSIYDGAETISRSSSAAVGASPSPFAPNGGADSSSAGVGGGGGAGAGAGDEEMMKLAAKNSRRFSATFLHADLKTSLLVNSLFELRGERLWTTH